MIADCQFVSIVLTILSLRVMKNTHPMQHYVLFSQILTILLFTVITELLRACRLWILGGGGIHPLACERCGLRDVQKCGFIELGPKPTFPALLIKSSLVEDITVTSRYYTARKATSQPDFQLPSQLQMSRSCGNDQKQVAIIPGKQAKKPGFSAPETTLLHVRYMFTVI